MLLRAFSRRIETETELIFIIVYKMHHVHSYCILQQNRSQVRSKGHVTLSLCHQVRAMHRPGAQTQSCARAITLLWTESKELVTRACI